VPIRRVKVDQEPSIPSHFPSGDIEIGDGVCVEDESRATTWMASTCDRLAASRVLGKSSMRCSNERIL
jgi:hypothetical protein